MSLHDENIVINIDENTNKHDEYDEHDENELETILKEINDFSYSEIENNNENDWYSTSTLIAKSIDYDTNYNVKQLMLICEYYGLSKEVKANRFKKCELIPFLLDFEENIENSLII